MSNEYFVISHENQRYIELGKLNGMCWGNYNSFDYELAKTSPDGSDTRNQVNLGHYNDLLTFVYRNQNTKIIFGDINIFLDYAYHNYGENWEKVLKKDNV